MGVKTVELDVVLGVVRVRIPGCVSCTVCAVLTAGCEAIGCLGCWTRNLLVVVAPPQVGRLPAEAHVLFNRMAAKTKTAITD
ncbi:MAG TPA: hypothetical protein ENH32_01100 [Proteobacteria bacterium]|nr:hypothetical protein [Pseudomonadota bacterium]